MFKRYLYALIICLIPMVSTANPVFKIAFAQDDMQNDFRRAQVEEAADRAKHYPAVEFIFSDAQGRTSLLMHQIEQFISQQVDALIIGTNDSKTVVPVIEKAHSKGIKVIILDRGVDTQSYSTFINSDNRQIGAIAGEYIAKQLKGQGRVLLLEGIQGADVTQHRSEGFLNVVGQYPELQVTRRTGNFLRKDALLATEELIQQGFRFDAIFAESDSMLSGVRPVIEQQGIDPDSIISVGVDYIDEARQAIISGTQTASIYFPLGGDDAVDAAVKLLQKQPVKRHLKLPADLLITKDNVDQVDPIF
ncbi:substrate-binding domain-containing protein [uncultured Neptuniibacter sp.]|uniref:substrate-binding domain-containing protein n=1 Tax=uncultured Neptuniibacter sp. TaxID=502143 RepID=UPI002611A2B1|nr:substrate-binding domain-containing protein [uncultured Neptuniibacter sp.]